MDYALIMTEGTDEKAFLEALLIKGILKFKPDELLHEEIYHARQINNTMRVKISTLPSTDTVSIYRVGDKLSDKLKLGDLAELGRITNIIDICILPELEILFILNEGRYNDYLKYKSRVKPSEYYKSINKSYNKQSSFVYDYFMKMSSNDIVKLIYLYVAKRGKSHKRDQHLILDLIND